MNSVRRASAFDALRTTRVDSSSELMRISRPGLMVSWFQTTGSSLESCSQNAAIRLSDTDNKIIRTIRGVGYFFARS